MKYQTEKERDRREKRTTAKKNEIILFATFSQFNANNFLPALIRCRQ